MRLQLSLSLLLCLAACEDPPAQAPAGSTTPRYERVESDAALLEKATQPVRVGELGPNFAACNWRGTTRRIMADRGQQLVVRAAPFETAHEVEQLPPGASFFICSRSLDQRWLGIVFDREGTAATVCQVTAPVPRRRDYEGPCKSGWVASAYVAIVAETPTSGEPTPEAATP